jgi:hypothetical protein
VVPPWARLVRNRKAFFVHRDASGGDVGVQRFGKRLVARHHVLLALKRASRMVAITA